MKDPSSKQDISHAKPVSSGFISDVHRSISPANDLSRLRNALNAASELPHHARDAWLLNNIADADEREAIATLLSLCDDDPFPDADGG